MTKTNIRIAKFSNFKMKMKLKLKIFPCKLYTFNIDVSNIEILHAHC
jgi:hypothetical protein